MLDDDHVLVVPHGEGLALIAADGSVVGSWPMDDLIACANCSPQGAAADGEGLLFSYSTTSPDAVDGGFVRIGPAGAEYGLSAGFQFAHDVARDPFDGTIIIVEATSNQLTWVAGDGSSSTPVRTMTAASIGVTETSPNSIEIIEDAGARFALVSWRGTRFGQDGRLALIEITDPDAPVLQWKFPVDGTLGQPHGARMVRYNGQWWITYAHATAIDKGEGTVGLAVTSDPRVVPDYVADLMPPDLMVFGRSVELAEDGLIIAADSGDIASAASTGKIYIGMMPELKITGASGAQGSGQVLVEWPATVLNDEFHDPYEAWIWLPTISP